MRHHRARQWELKLKRVFDEIDAELESEYGGRFPLHPSRPRRGTTSNPEADGLFNVGASFSAGYGSEHGRGYVVEVQMSTLSRVPADDREEIMERAVTLLRKKLPTAFPKASLEVERDGPKYKITGDFSLGSL